jgi:UDP-N-acetyl-D-glucosamine dehydrogenase
MKRGKRGAGVELMDRIKNRKARVGVIGLGYVGLPLALEFARRGFPTLGLDIDPGKITSLKNGKSYIHHIPSQQIKRAQKRARFSVTTDFSRIRELECIVICVPTPLGAAKQRPDLSSVKNTAQTIGRHLKPNQLIVLESTTYPGTTREIVLPALGKSGLQCGKDFFLAYSPEREDPGVKGHSARQIPKVVGGVDKLSGDLAEQLYRNIAPQTVRVTSTEAAEATKMLENTFRAVNIAFVNELKILFDKMKIDVWEVIRASSTKPFGFMPFYPGPGLGGHCIPIDPFYLAWKAQQYGMRTEFIELAGKINTSMPHYVVGKVQEALSCKRRALRGSKILILGMAYKKDVDDCRESPSIELAEILHKKGARVSYHDPHVPQIPSLRHHTLRSKSVKWGRAALAGADCVLVATAHSFYDPDFIGHHARLIVDARHLMNDSRWCSKVVQA